MTAADIDLLYDVVRHGTELEQFDVDGNGVIDAADANFLVTNILGTVFGDANLDGVVDVSDFNRWNASKFQSCATSWSHGNFNGDLSVDAADFNLWMSPFRPQEAATGAVASERSTPRAALGQVAADRVALVDRALGGDAELHQQVATRDPGYEDVAQRSREGELSRASHVQHATALKWQRWQRTWSVARRQEAMPSAEDVDVGVLDGVWQGW